MWITLWFKGDKSEKRVRGPAQKHAVPEANAADKVKTLPPKDLQELAEKPGRGVGDTRQFS
jgi:hypothetical protein